MKDNYVVIINWSGENHKFETKAHNETHALRRCQAALSKKLGVTNYYVRNHCKNYEVRREL